MLPVLTAALEGQVQRWIPTESTAQPLVVVDLVDVQALVTTAVAEEALGPTQDRQSP